LPRAPATGASQQRHALRALRWPVRGRLGRTVSRGRLGNVCTSDRGAGGRGGGRFTREGATKAELGGAELARAGTRPRGVFRSALACRRPGTTPSATYRVVQRLLSRPRRA